MRTYVSLVAVVVALMLTACGTPAADPAAAALAPTALATATAMPQPSATVVPTATPLPTATAMPTATRVPTATSQPSATPEPPAPSATPALEAAQAAPAAEVVAADVNDTPALSTDQQSVTEVAHTQATHPSQPVRIQIPTIKLDYKPVPVGLDARGVPIVPKHDVGWYIHSAMPGQGDNVVFWGHVLRFKSAPHIPAPFARVKELKPGAQIIITTASGKKLTYRVTKAVQVTPDQVQYILPTGKEQVTLVSCIGDNVVTNGKLTKKYRLITIAEPAK
ncbi:sortase [Kallotenue papyrolyticum]|uniref:sortase n=1 Tax=Kallotenue papyrolyticum TaxID=1325125 RepID=UPI0004785859|nr:class F sortase [Kallotenue papyrolyticum]